MPAFLARRYAEPVDVFRADEAPAHFVWRGRHYTVRQVLARWIRTGAWWQQPDAARLVTGEPAPDADHADHADLGVACGEVDDDEREFWRVEAAGGSGRTPVVVELCFTWGTGAWTLTAVAD